MAAKCIDTKIGVDTKGLDHFHSLDHRTVIRRLVSVKLYGLQTQRKGKVLQALRITMIDKDANSSHKRWKLLDNLRGSRRFNIPRAVWMEIQTDRICAQQRRVPRVFKLSYAANLDARHSKPRIAVAGSGAVKKCSPMRKASAPAPSRRSISGFV